MDIIQKLKAELAGLTTRDKTCRIRELVSSCSDFDSLFEGDILPPTEITMFAFGGVSYNRGKILLQTAAHEFVKKHFAE